MDKLTERINRIGVTADVNSYLMWRGLADQAISDYLNRLPLSATPWAAMPL
jgi:hypothetical protein